MKRVPKTLLVVGGAGVTTLAVQSAMMLQPVGCGAQAIDATGLYPLPRQRFIDLAR